MNGSTNKIIPFGYGDNLVRAIEDENGNPLWIAKDICDVLGISKHRDAIQKLDDDERCPVKVDTLGGVQEMTAINESGLYTLILRSNKPEAKKFKKWVTSEVLPTIRKTGSYGIGGNNNVMPILTEIVQQNQQILSVLVDITNKITSEPTTQSERLFQIVPVKPTPNIKIDREVMDELDITFDEYCVLQIISQSKEWAKYEVLEDSKYFQITHNDFLELLPQKRSIKHIQRKLKILKSKKLIEVKSLRNLNYIRLSSLGTRIEDI